MFNIVKTAAEVAVFTVNSHSLNMEWREKMAKQPIALIIMDGYGINKTVEGNAIAAAKKPNLDKLPQYAASGKRSGGRSAGRSDGKQ